jgi:hypothetical protein
MLTELRLPTSVTKLIIDSHTQLTPSQFSIGDYRYGTDNKIGGNGEYLNDYTALTDIKVIDTNIDTYSMVRGARNLEKYCLRGVDWEITEIDTQYCLRRNDESLDPAKIPSYYYYDASA